MIIAQPEIQMISTLFKVFSRIQRIKILRKPFALFRKLYTGIDRRTDENSDRDGCTCTGQQRHTGQLR